MAIRKEDLIKLIHVLPKKASQSAYDYLKFLRFITHAPIVMRSIGWNLTTNPLQRKNFIN
ncbi:hypothetical protein BEP19_00455 [Ammoniphilus oxalaticus]|uniref:Uncharacterized protein n=1 Tax=Ammoniphilus oxalaticus TaxID=66863 RepID=A0A419SRF3_9BACL|nr:hypothetical protein [Ammoniphilus oxalaticus]RKD27079.1 hypothetical protein BEP19_00455 [Ammoniphilus oxalaticus]